MFFIIIKSVCKRWESVPLGAISPALKKGWVEWSVFLGRASGDMNHWFDVVAEPDLHERFWSQDQ